MKNGSPPVFIKSTSVLVVNCKWWMNGTQVKQSRLKESKNCTLFLSMWRDVNGNLFSGNKTEGWSVKKQENIQLYECCRKVDWDEKRLSQTVVWINGPRGSLAVSDKSRSQLKNLNYKKYWLTGEEQCEV
jgi:hypothetical protein